MMGFRFHRSIWLLPGVHVNLGQSGPSLSVGPRGASVNFSERGTRTSVEVPCAGISWSETDKASHAPADNYDGGPTRGAMILVALMLVVGAATWALLR
jgi:hypothetical protein